MKKSLLFNHLRGIGLLMILFFVQLLFNPLWRNLFHKHRFPTVWSRLLFVTLSIPRRYSCQRSLSFHGLLGLLIIWMVKFIFLAIFDVSPLSSLAFCNWTGFAMWAFLPPTWKPLATLAHVFLHWLLIQSKITNISTLSRKFNQEQPNAWEDSSSNP